MGNIDASTANELYGTCTRKTLCCSACSKLDLDKQALSPKLKLRSWAYG